MVPVSVRSLLRHVRDWLTSDPDEALSESTLRHVREHAERAEYLASLEARAGKAKPKEVPAPSNPKALREPWTDRDRERT